MNKTALEKFNDLYTKIGEPRGLRFGQFFVSRYMKTSWPELFYEEDDLIAIELIHFYLAKLHYTNELPKPIFLAEEQKFHDKT